MPARLVNAYKSALGWTGRVELLFQSNWMPVCRSGFSTVAATVVCQQVRIVSAGCPLTVHASMSGQARLLCSLSTSLPPWPASAQLALGNNGTVLPSTGFGEGTGMLRMHNISCKGTEKTWRVCPGVSLSATKCDASGQAALLCSWCQEGGKCGAKQREFLAKPCQLSWHPVKGRAHALTAALNYPRRQGATGERWHRHQ